MTVVSLDLIVLVGCVLIDLGRVDCKCKGWTPDVSTDFRVVKDESFLVYRQALEVYVVDQASRQACMP